MAQNSTSGKTPEVGADAATASVSGNLLVVVLDVNPDQRMFFGKSPARMMQWLNSALALVNSHLLLDPSNEVAVVGVSKNVCEFLYPDVNEPSSDSGDSGQQRPVDGQYEGFREAERTIRRNVNALIRKELQSPSIAIDSLVAGGLCMALAYINRKKTDSRILVMTASGATASQYMNYMNAFFTAQKMGVSVDTCILDRESGLLQQGADITNGLYLRVPNLESLFQFLVWVFLPEVKSSSSKKGLREKLGLPSSAKVDYRAACFCHRQLVDVGFVCSVCLSIFCKFSPICTTCHTVFKVKGPPALAGMAKKKKK